VRREVQPLVSIIVPIRDEERLIERCLTAVLNQTYPAERVEVIVADGMSEDRTREVIASLPGAERIRVLDNPAKLQAAGLNLCIESARGDVIVRVDGHTIIAPDYVSHCVAALEATGAWNVGGAISNTGTTAMGRAIAAAGTSSFGVPGAFHGGSRPCFTDTVYLGAWPRAVFDRVGRFSPDLAVNEDYELNHRIRRAGGSIYYSPSIRCQYHGRQTLSALTRQYVRYGRGKVRMLARHPGSLKWRHLVAPCFVAVLMAGAPLALWLPVARAPWVTVVATYAALNVLFSTRLAASSGWGLMPRITAAFATMHLAWGIGFWVELARLARR
jgi:cellulose synthase/poly-beta-1,6-N-acetylglucosamine synthase-like glycosyltransferase